MSDTHNHPVAGLAAFTTAFHDTTRDASGSVFSPPSIAKILALLHAGANGRTKDEIHNVLRFPSGGDAHLDYATMLVEAGHAQGVELTSVSQAFLQRGYALQPAYWPLVRGYGAQFDFVDFHADSSGVRERVNRFISNLTRGKIPELFAEAFNSTMRMVLANAVYFKGAWLRPFDDLDTRRADFTRVDGRHVTVSMMRRAARFRYHETPICQVLDLPYAGDEVSMMVVLPRRETSLAEAEALAHTGLIPWMRLLDDEPPTQVSVSLPRFKITSRIDLRTALSAMGIRDAFDERVADFSGVSTPPNLYVSSAVHQAVVDVDEYGTEAAAATGATMSLRGLPPPATPFVADRPFLFVIRHRATSVPLFVGRVTDPTA